jgi:tyrosyl-tRNA synthetase
MSDTTQSSQTNTLPELLTRGVEQIMPDAKTLSAELSKRTIRVYLGIDPTGAFLTLGHSVVLRKLQQFAQAGHNVIMLIGNGTVRIGDPTGRDSTRPELTDEVIQANFKTWKEQASKILDFNKIEIRYNGDWLDNLKYVDMIKLMAQTTVQQLVERDMFQERMKKGLPIHGHELLYPLLQGYDSVAMDVDLEIGGSDQLFNMMMGRHLQRVMNNREKWVLTTPIINGTDGRKMSKSYGNYVALTDAPNDMFGKLMSIADEQIVEYFTLLTDTPLDAIDFIKTKIAQGENPMQFKKQLAFTITEMYHDKASAEAAQENFQKTVQERSVPDEVPTVQIAGPQMSVLELLVSCIPDQSKSELRRLVEQGGVSWAETEEKLLDPMATVTITDSAVLKVGKRRYFKLVPLA